MPTRLIINADDFGLTRGINRAVGELHRASVLTSATLTASGAAFDDAVALSAAHPALGVGCHVVLVDGAPISPPREVPTLLGRDGVRFRRSVGEFVRDLLLGWIDPGEMAREAAAQIAKLIDAGIRVTHVDTHKHTHMFPAVARALLGVRGVAAIRNPFEPAASRGVAGASQLRRLQTGLLGRLEPRFQSLATDMLSTNGTLGIAATGTLDAATLRSLLTALPEEGTYELLCHPGYSDADLDCIPTRLRHHRDVERDALLLEVPRMLAAADAPELIHYGNLRGEGRKEPGGTASAAAVGNT